MEPTATESEQGNTDSPEPSGSSSALRWMLGLLPIAVSVALLVVLIGETDARDLLMEADWRWLLVALAVSFVIVQFFGAWKWRFLMQSMGIDAPYWMVFRIWFGLAITLFMPLQSGHIIYAMALKRATNIKFVEAFECVFYDRYLTLVGTFAWIVIGQAFIDPTHALASPWVLLGSVGVLAFYILDSVLMSALGRFQIFRRHSRLIRNRWGLKRKLQLLLAAMVYQSSDLISVYFACLVLGLVVDPMVILSVLPVVVLLSFVPITFSGFGAREGLIALFMSMQVTESQGVALGLISNFVEYLAPAVLSLLVLRGLLKITLSKDRTD